MTSTRSVATEAPSAEPTRGLQVRDVVHSFGDRVALDGVSFDVVPGVLTGLLGPNGAGKTTVMRVMLGVLAPQRGEVRYDGRAVGPAERRRWGYMPQERGLYPGMPVGEQVVYFARLHGLSRRDSARRGRAVLEELGVAERWADRTDKLSGGGNIDARTVQGLSGLSMTTKNESRYPNSRLRREAWSPC